MTETTINMEKIANLIQIAESLLINIDTNLTSLVEMTEEQIDVVKKWMLQDENYHEKQLDKMGGD